MKKHPAKHVSAEKMDKMVEILEDLKQRMREIDELGKKIKTEGRYVSPRRTMHLLEEIKVPPLRLLKETS